MRCVKSAGLHCASQFVIEVENVLRIVQVCIVIEDVKMCMRCMNSAGAHCD